MIWKIIKWGFLISLILLIVSAALFIYKPQMASKVFTTVTSVIFNTKPYNTKNKIHPFLQAKVDLIIKDARAQGIDLRVVQGFRTLATQQKYYKQGRSTKGGKITNAPPGFSYHNYGFAVDVCEYKNGKPYWKSKHWQEIGAIGKSHGLVWGGDWKRLVDKPHLQLSISDVLFHCVF